MGRRACSRDQERCGAGVAARADRFDAVEIDVDQSSGSLAEDDADVLFFAIEVLGRGLCADPQALPIVEDRPLVAERKGDRGHAVSDIIERGGQDVGGVGLGEVGHCRVSGSDLETQILPRSASASNHRTISRIPAPLARMASKVGSQRARSIPAGPTISSRLAPLARKLNPASPAASKTKNAGPSTSATRL